MWLRASSSSAKPSSPPQGWSPCSLGTGRVLGAHRLCPRAWHGFFQVSCGPPMLSAPGPACICRLGKPEVVCHPSPLSCPCARWGSAHDTVECPLLLAALLTSPSAFVCSRLLMSPSALSPPLLLLAAVALSSWLAGSILRPLRSAAEHVTECSGFQVLLMMCFQFSFTFRSFRFFVACGFLPKYGIFT